MFVIPDPSSVSKSPRPNPHGFSLFVFFSTQIPLVIMMQSSSATLGSFTLYRTSIQSLVYSIRNLINMARLAFQGVFLMGAFCCAMAYEPKLEPKEDVRTPYQPTKRGMKIEARYTINFHYPIVGRNALIQKSRHP